LRGTAQAIHTGDWGAANLEVCEAAITSSQQKTELSLKHQVAMGSIAPRG